MVQVLLTIAAICKKFNITETQFSKATYVAMNGTGYYVVESQSTDAEYHVRYNRQYGKLSCTCKANQNGFSCWHMRAAMAAQEHHKAEQAARRQREQAEVEATKLYQFEQAIVELENALDKLDEIARQADLRDAAHEAVLKALA